MMKRQCCFCIAVLLVTLSLLAVLPVHAQADYAFATLDYVMDPAEGEETGKSAHVADKMEFERAVTITWRTEEATLFLEGTQVTEGSLRLDQAGMYRLNVKKINSTESKAYTVYVLPDINLKDGDVFTAYPTIECSNVADMTLDAATQTQIKNFPSGQQVRTLGKHTLTVTGYNMAWDYSFYIKVCAVSPVPEYVESLGKYALTLTVGSFDDHAVSVTLDAEKQLEAGAVEYITAVGPHFVSATLDQLAVNDLHMLPASEQLILRPEFYLPQTELDEPITLLLSRYDGNFYVLIDYDESTGNYKRMERIEGDYRLERDGCHALVALDEKGNEIPYVFMVRRNNDDKGTTMGRIVLTFNNPHNTYAILMLPLSVLMLAAIAWFFVKRRRIV